MNNNQEHIKGPDTRQENRFYAKGNASVEFKPEKLELTYQFRLRDVSQCGMCILVKDDSAILDFIHVGDTISMKYHPDQVPSDPVVMKTKITHISASANGKFKNHQIVGLLILGSH